MSGCIMVVIKNKGSGEILQLITEPIHSPLPFSELKPSLPRPEDLGGGTDDHVSFELLCTNEHSTVN